MRRFWATAYAGKSFSQIYWFKVKLGCIYHFPRLIWNSERTDVRLLFQINRDMIYIIGFWVDSIRFRKDFSECTLNDMFLLPIAIIINGHVISPPIPENWHAYLQSSYEKCFVCWKYLSWLEAQRLVKKCRHWERIVGSTL